MLLNHIVPHIELLLRKNQNGFRGRSTLSQILCLRRLIEESQAFNKDLALVFVDFSKPFDSVDRNKMFEILELYGIPPKIIDCIKVLYTDTSATILTPDGETEAFSILAGILQGDTLAPASGRDSLHKKLREKNPAKKATLFSMYKIKRNMIVSLIRSSKKIHYQNYFQKYQSDAKKNLGGYPSNSKFF